jgi:hypothetical protein
MRLIEKYPYDGAIAHLYVCEVEVDEDAIASGKDETEDWLQLDDLRICEHPACQIVLNALLPRL